MTLFISCSVAAFAVFAALSAIFGLYGKNYNSKKISHNALIFLCVGACGFLAYWIFHLLFKESIPYPFEGDLARYSPYEQLFDALMKHQLRLDVEPSPALAEMLNPYDWAARDELGVSYLWDRAYFEGSYYCYFGIAPVLLVYYPFYFVTKAVPSAQTVCFIMSFITVFVIAALTVKIQKLFLKEVNLFLLAFSIITVEFGSLVFMVQSSADFYYTAVQSGILFLALFLLTTLTAYEKKTVGSKCLFFALSAVSLVFLVLSRPNMALFALMGIPVYLNVLLNKDFSAKIKLRQVLSFAVPVCIGAAFVMWYNYARFGNVFEFGSVYQLTVHDVHEYSLSAALILPTFYYYFIKQPEIIGELPYLKISFVNIIKEMNYNGYVYLTSTVGALSLPCNWAIFASLPLYAGEKNKVKTGFVLSGAACVFVIAFVDMCLGGVNIRYLADIMLVMTLLATLVLVDLMNGITDKKALKLTVFLITVLILLLSATVGALLIINNERDYIMELITKA
jgi:hypothetical protein